MDTSTLIGRQLKAVWLSHPRVQPHAAWATPDTPGIQVLFVNLACAGTPVVHIVADEVAVPGSYPALGIDVGEVQESPERGRWYEGTDSRAEVYAELVQHFPAEIKSVRLWDSMGEGPDSAIDIALSSGVRLRIRHTFPPMILGVELLMMCEEGNI